MRDMNSNRRTELAGFLRARRARLSPRRPACPRRARRTDAARPGCAVRRWPSWRACRWLLHPAGAGPRAAPVPAGAGRAGPGADAHRGRARLPVPHGRPGAAAGTRPSREISPGIRHLLDSMPGIPAYVVDAAYNVLAWNRLATHFIGDLSRYEDRNMIRWTFLRAPQEVVWSDANFVRFTRSTVADLRAAYARYPGDPGIDSLVTELLALSPRFAGMWAEHEVEVRGPMLKHVDHPLLTARWSSSARCCTSPRPASASSPTAPPPARPPRLPSPNWPTAPRCPARGCPQVRHAHETPFPLKGCIREMACGAHMTPPRC